MELINYFIATQILQEATWLSFPVQPGSEGGMERAGNNNTVIFKLLEEDALDGSSFNIAQRNNNQLSSAIY